MTDQTVPSEAVLSIEHVSRVHGSGATAVLALDGVSLDMGGADLIRLVTGRQAPAGALRTLDDGGMVVFQRSTGTVTRVEENSSQTLHLPTYRVGGGNSYYSLPGGVISRATASRLGLHPVLDSIVLDTGHAPSTAELETVNRLLAKALGTRAAQVRASVATPDGTSNTGMILLLAAHSAFVTLAATGIAVGLSAAESRATSCCWPRSAPLPGYGACWRPPRPV